MNNARENLTPWTTLLGSGTALLGVLQSAPALILAGITLSAAAASAALVSERRLRGADPMPPKIERLNLDSLHVANLRRRLNKSLKVERAFQVAIIEGADLHLAWQYDGYCQSKTETGIEFSLDSENNIPFEQLECFAFDLQNDPARLRQIRPSLVGSDGVSKKVSVSFLKPLAKDDRFSVLLHCKLPACISTGVQYYTSSLSFDQQVVDSASVQLIFVRSRPEWVRVYEFDKNARPTFVSELRPFRDDGATCEYVDMVQNVPGQSVRVYLYDLPKLGDLNTPLRADAACNER
jgi:hypothetical protein